MILEKFNEILVHVAEEASLGGYLSSINDDNKLLEMFLKLYPYDNIFASWLDFENSTSLVRNNIISNPILRKLNTEETINNIIKNLKIIKKIKINNSIVYFCSNCIVVTSSSPSIINRLINFTVTSSLYIVCDFKDLKTIVKEEYIIYNNEDTRAMNYVTYSSRGFTSKKLEVLKPNINISLNYNNDFPYERIKEILNSKESGLIILNGIPGSGKTYAIRDLIYNIDKNFIFLDSSCFNFITDSSFIELLTEFKDSIFVLEDCETLLQDRSLGNERLSALLNLTDGILGDSLNLKFICTFNSDLTSVDKAILRQGRLKLKYEFKKLTVDKVKALCDKLGIDLIGKYIGPTALCDIYNFNIETGNKEPKKIGF